MYQPTSSQQPMPQNNMYQQQIYQQPIYPQPIIYQILQPTNTPINPYPCIYIPHHQHSQNILPPNINQCYFPPHMSPNIYPAASANIYSQSYHNSSQPLPPYISSQFSYEIPDVNLLNSNHQPLLLDLLLELKKTKVRYIF